MTKRFEIKIYHKDPQSHPECLTEAPYTDFSDFEMSTLSNPGFLAHSTLKDGGFPTIGYDMTAEFLRNKIQPYVDKFRD